MRIPRPRRPGELQVLVVYSNFAVGMALSRRLLDHAVVALARMPAALSALDRASAYDVVVLCPYLSPHDRDAALEAAAARAPQPAVIELLDAPGDLIAVRTVSAGGRRFSRPDLAPVLAALTAPAP